ncbi:MAG: cobalamin-dependent protein, partial [Paracoccaceae bacterium]
ALAGDNIMPASIIAAKAGVTTGEWAAGLRDIFGEYRAPTGVSETISNSATGLDDLRAEVAAFTSKRQRRLTLVIGKPGLDGHSNGAEQIAVRARDCGMRVIYEGIRLTPEAIVEAVASEGADVLGLSILSGSHVPLVRETLARMAKAGLGHVPVVVGGIIPPDDAAALCAEGVAQIYTPKDFDLNAIMHDLVKLAGKGGELAAQ